MKLFNIIKSTAKKMMIDFEEITSQLEHRGLKGKGREGIVGQFLSSYLPNSYEFMNGTIISASGIQSKEQDIIIADNSRLVSFLDSQSVAAVPVESVLATIEIKSKLTSEELTGSIENIHSIRSLAKHYFGKTGNTLGPHSFIFAFTSAITIEKALEVLRSVRKRIPLAHFPSAIVCLDRGSILLLKKTNLNIVTLEPDESVTWGTKHTTDPADNLMMLYLLVATSLFSSRPDQNFPDLLTYAQKSGFILPETKLSVSDAADTYYFFNGKEISSNAVMKSTDLIEKLFEKDIQDSEIIELFYLMSQNPYTESFRRETVYFVENGRPIIPWSAKEIFDAIIRHQGEDLDDQDKEKLDTFCRVIREAVDSEKYVEIGDLEMDARPGKKYIRTKGYKPKR